MTRVDQQLSWKCFEKNLWKRRSIYLTNSNHVVNAFNLGPGVVFEKRQPQVAKSLKGVNVDKGLLRLVQILTR